jgi:hypothetical protein
MKTFAQAARIVVEQHNPELRELCVALAGPLAEIKAAGISPEEQLNCVNVSSQCGADFLAALRTAVHTVLGAACTDETAASILWGSDSEYYARRLAQPPLTNYWGPVIGQPPGPRTDGRVVEKLTHAGRLTRGLLEQHWNDVLRYATLEHVAPAMNPSTLDASVAKRIGRLLGMLGSDHDGEVLNAVGMLKKLFCNEKMSFSDLAYVVENSAGAEIRRQFYDPDGTPNWHQLALYCQRHIDQLPAKEQAFVTQMAGWTVGRAPSEKQAVWLESIFVRLGAGDS